VIGLTAPVVSRAVRLTLVWLALAAFVFTVEYNANDYFVHLLPVYLSFSVWIGLAAGRLMDWAARRSAWLRPALIVAAAVWLAQQLAVVGPRVSARDDRRAEDFLAAVLRLAPPDALIATRTDRDSFALWYGRFALRARPDVVVVVEPMLPYAWYRANLRAVYTTPSVAVPEDARINADRLAELNRRPLCRTDLEAETPLLCAGDYNQITTRP